MKPSFVGTTPDSYYQASANAYPDIGPISQDYDVDICIVGAGITGLSAAIELSRQGYSTLVLEEQTIGFGGSGRSGGQILIGFNESISSLNNRFGQGAANRLWHLSEDAVALTKKNIKQYQIDCDFQPGVLCLTQTKSGLDYFKNYQQQLTKKGIPAELLQGNSLTPYIRSEDYIGGLYEATSGHVHPLNYSLGLAHAAISNGAIIHDHSKVETLDISRKTLRVGRYNIQAQHIILAGNALLGNILPGLAKNILPVTSHIIATQPLDENPIPGNSACWDDKTLLSYFRMSRDGRLLFGGRPGVLSHDKSRTELLLKKRMLQIFPQLDGVDISWSWGGLVGITHPQVPQIKSVGPNIWLAQGYSGHGMALSALAGNIVAHAINGQMDDFDLFEKVNHMSFPESENLRSGVAQLGMFWYLLKERMGL